MGIRPLSAEMDLREIIHQACYEAEEVGGFQADQITSIITDEVQKYFREQLTRDAEAMKLGY